MFFKSVLDITTNIGNTIPFEYIKSCSMRHKKHIYIVQEHLLKLAANFYIYTHKLTVHCLPIIMVSFGKRIINTRSHAIRSHVSRINMLSFNKNLTWIQHMAKSTRIVWSWIKSKQTKKQTISIAMQKSNIIQIQPN